MGLVSALEMTTSTTSDARFEALLSVILQLRLPYILLMLKPGGDRVGILRDIDHINTKPARCTPVTVP